MQRLSKRALHIATFQWLPKNLFSFKQNIPLSWLSIQIYSQLTLNEIVLQKNKKKKICSRKLTKPYF